MDAATWFRSERGRLALASVVVFAATVATFFDAIHNDFVNYDDWGYVFDKRTQQGLSVENVGRAFTEIILGNYHPLSWLSHMADVELFGADPRGHHAVSVLLHGAVAVMVLQLLRRVGAGLMASVLLTLFFSLHPLRVESVAWVSERKDVLSGLFYVLAVWLWAAPLEGRPRSTGLVALATMAAMLSKPMAVSLPVIFVLFDLLLLKASAVEVARRTAPFFGLALLLAGVTLYAQARGMQSTALIPPGMRLQTFFVSHGAFYLPSTVAPDCLHAPYLYPDAWPVPLVVGSVAAVGALLTLAWWCRRRAPLTTAGVLWYLVAMVPVSGLVMVGIAPAADRYTYIPSMGLALALWPLAHALSGRVPGHLRGPVLASVGLVIASGSFLCQPQIAVWRSTRTVFEHALSCTPDHPHVLEFLGSMDLTAGDLDRAETRTRRALELRPSLPEVWIQLGAIRLMKRDFTGARDAFVESLSWYPDGRLAHLGLSVALEATGETTAAAAEFELGRGPFQDDALTRRTIARIFDELGQPDRASQVRADLERALAARPDAPPPDRPMEPQ